MEKQMIVINGKSIYIPNYYERIESLPDDPKDSIPFMAQTENATCFLLLHPINESQSLPRKKDSLISGIKHYLRNNQGLIQADVEQNYVYSIVKSLNQESGVQYILTYQKFYHDCVLNIQGFFEELGITGIRDSIVYEMCRRKNIVGTENDPFKGWVKDPYDERIKDGALMNLSEQEQFDDTFPGFPLSMCRELVMVLAE